MKTKIFTLSVVLFITIACNNDDDNCATEIDITNLEDEYGCTNTEYDMDIDLSDEYTIINSQTAFDSLVTGHCNPEIDFISYDLLIGKKGLPNGNISIDYQLIENCGTGHQTLTVTFNQNETTEAPNLTYHALIPKRGDEQGLSVDLIIN